LDCVDIKYDVNYRATDLVSKWQSAFSDRADNKPTGYARVWVGKNLLSDVVYVHQPAILKFDFINHLAGLASLWLGVSFLTFYDDVLKVIRWIRLHATPGRASAMNTSGKDKHFKHIS